MSPCIQHNPWVACATLLTLRWAATGVAWCWLIPIRPRRRAVGVGAGLAAIGIGFVASTLWAMGLAEGGRFTPFADWMGIAAFTFAGLAAGCRRGACRTSIRAAWPALPMVWVVSALIMLLPRQGEWIVGGWDPGTYVVQGCWVEQTGTFRPAPDPLFSVLHEPELDVFAPRVFTFTEGLPVFPLDPQTRSFTPFFFRFMPSLTAVLARCGGVRAATRVNFWAGALAAAMLTLFCWMVSRNRFWTLSAGLLTVLHPVWLYHLRFPTTELLQQYLFFAIAALAVARRAAPTARGLMPVALFALLSLHISMALFAALLLVAWSWADLTDPARADVIRARLLQIGGMAGGLAFNLMTAAVTVERLGSILIPLLGLAACLALAALVIDVVASLAWGRRFVPYAGPVIVAGAVAVGLAVLLAVVTGLGHGAIVRGNVRAIGPFLSPVLIAFAVPGLLVFRPGARVSRPALAMQFVLLAATGMTVWESAITPLYPWATRRYVAFTIPLLGMLAATTLTLLREAIRPWHTARRLAVLLPILLLLVLAGRLRRVLALSEYDGLSIRLAEVAGQTEPGDVIIPDRFRYGVPLRFLYDRGVLNGERLIAVEGPDRIRFAAGILHRLHAAGWRIRFLTSTAAGMDAFPFGLHGLSTDWKSEPFRLRELRHDVHIRDYESVALDRLFALHTWHPPDADWLDDSPVRQAAGEVDIGTLADAWFVAAGFHGRELTDKGTVSVRWTDEYAVVALPSPPPGRGLDVEIDYIDRYRPPFLPGEAVTLDINGHPLTAQARRLPHAVRLAARIPDSLTETAHLRLGIRAPVWFPRAVTQGADVRRLGVMLDRVRFAPAPAAPELRSPTQ